MQAVQSEVQQTSNNAVAKQIVSMLWEQAIAVQGPSKRPGDDAVIACNLVELITGLTPSPFVVKSGCVTVRDNGK